MITVENLSKRYKIKSGKERDRAHSYSTLRESLTNGVKSILSFRGFKPQKHDEFWAIRDISFEVKQGEVVGLIGRNGAGKSTLLKLLSRITAPTKGRISLEGKVGSLLEVGTGFHPELTGRENIFLNGAILGMKRTEIKSNFDEIVEFAGVEKFLETPVKRFSSGMYVRLAFSVAAHLLTEILLVDEVLAVGDNEFQKKCLNKIKDVSTGGRTIFFVSHNMSTILSLCSRCIFLKDGAMEFDASPQETVGKYMEDAQPTTKFDRPMQHNGDPTLVQGKLTMQETDGKFWIYIQAVIESAMETEVCFNICLKDKAGSKAGFTSLGGFNNEDTLKIKQGQNPVNVRIDGSNLAVGNYYARLDLSRWNVRYFDEFENCFYFEIQKSPKTGSHRVFSEKWGRGSVEFPIELLD